MSLPVFGPSVPCHVKDCPGRMYVRDKSCADDVYHMYELRCSVCERREDLEGDES